MAVESEASVTCQWLGYLTSRWCSLLADVMNAIPHGAFARDPGFRMPGPWPL